MSRRLPPAGVDADEDEFRTRTVLIRYCEEEAELNNTACFRVERDSRDVAPLSLEVRLMFADIGRHGGLDGFIDETLPAISPGDFQEVSSQTLRLHSVLPGMQAYCPVVFDEFHFCRVDLMVRTSLLDFHLKFAPPETLAGPERPTPLSPVSKNGRCGVCGTQWLAEEADEGEGESLRTTTAPPPLSSRSRGVCGTRWLAAGADDDDDPESPGPLAVRPALAACGLRRPPGGGQGGLGAAARRGGGGQPASLERAFIQLARETGSSVSSSRGVSGSPRRAVSGDGGEGHPNEGRPLCMNCRGRTKSKVLDVPELGLGDALDLLQQECISRFAAARKAIIKGLTALKADGDPGLPAQLRLPGCGGGLAEGAEGTQQPGDSGSGAVDPLVRLPVPPSRRLSDIIGSAAAAQHERPSLATAAAMLLTEDLAFVAAQVTEAWNILLLQAASMSTAVAAMPLRAAWHERLRRHWAESTFSSVLPANAVATGMKQEDAWTAHARAAIELRQSKEYQQLIPHLIEDLSVSLPPDVHTIIFDQRYAEGASPDSEAYVRGKPVQALGVKGRRARGLHIFVLVHGFQGQAFDMRLIKNNISLLYPRSLCLCSTSNERDTEVDIEKMAANLADEVKDFIQDWCPGPPEPRLGRLSFVAHSIGGLVVRAALPLLQEYHDRLFTFVSFSTPHLGYAYASNILFRTGLWLVKKLKKSRCLEQLCMTDSKVADQSFLSRLSRKPGLEHFQHVVLGSSCQDQYAPYESARIESSPSADKDPDFGGVYQGMVKSLLGPLKPERVLRVDFNFHMPETNLDTMIGRAAHIQFIECQALMRMFIHSYGFLFE